ncbi:hypothetical protein CARUB_v10015837mg [Capsella rubella]|uniref:Pathogenesis-related protein 1 n=1 Tax=Capsella rubella TaxID=81985 RepID=R0I7V6_9BRAS|nr:pathogenesis-related protein 1 isoform X1 [Capsella rubella]EOA32548.1 hypothetical protein CARUB_v10015837mg [Capsella rubella]
MHKKLCFGFSFTVLSLFSVLTEAYRHHTSAQPPRANENGDVKPQQTLLVHNKARAMVGVGPMVWNETLATYAQNYAQERARDCAMEHSSGPFGENLAAGWGTMSGPVATEYWMTEKEHYDYYSNTCGGEDGVCGHYTQIVWRDSVRLGCGSVRCKNDEYIWVICSYDPPGNYIGQRPY